MDKKRLGFWAPILVLAAALVLFAVSVDAVEAGGRGGGTTTATLSVSPNPAPAGTTSVTISGSGFKPGQQVWTGMVGFISHMVTADSSGSLSYVETQGFTAGNYQVVAYTEGGGSKWVLTASTSFTVL